MRVEPFACIRPRADVADRVVYAPFGAYDREKAFSEAASNPLSFISIDWPEALYPLEEQVELSAAHARARSLLLYRLREGILEEDAPAVFHYRLECKGCSQAGWVCRAPVAAFIEGEIRPHEETLEGREGDRSAHIRALGIQAAPVFLMYRQTDALKEYGRRVRSERPLLSLNLPDGSSHGVWRLEGTRAEEIVRAFGEVSCAYVADGHHRLAAAVHVGCRYVLCSLFPSDEVRVLPYDRLVVDAGGCEGARLLSGLEGIGLVPEECSEMVVPASRGEIGLFDGTWWRVRVPDGLRGPTPRESLDVSVLQREVFGPLFGATNPRGNGRLAFVGGGDPVKLEESVRCGRAKAAFSTFAISTEEIMAVADAGEVVPPKSTWFDPKPYVGLFAMRA